MEIKEYPIQRREFRIKVLYEMYKEGSLKLNPEYQRSYVWKKKREKREKLIDSILRDFDIGKIFLNEVQKIKEGEVKVYYECLDGQQRLRTIFDFIDGKFTTSDKITKEIVKPKKFDELDSKYRTRITEWTINPVVATTDDDEIISEIFLRLQEGVPLKSPEKLNAERGAMRNGIVKISKHKFFDRTGVNPYRFAHRYLAAQIMHLEEQNVTGSLNFVNIGFKELRKTYRSYRNEKRKVRRLSSKVKTNLNFLETILGKDTGIIKSKGDLISIYLLTSYVREKYVVRGKEAKFKDFLMDFLTKVANISTRKDERTENNAPYYDYKEKRRRSTTSGRMIEERFNITLQEFLKFLPSLRLKDEKRMFDWGQKLAIYRKQKGRCKKCGEKLEIKEAEFHHRQPHTEGGPTTVENGEMYHPKCHPR